MKSLLLVAQNTLRELHRDKVLYILVFLSFLLLIVSVLFSNLSIQENLRLTINLGLSGIHLSIQIISIFIGSTLIFREIEKKSILFMMSYPISRERYVLGKFLGQNLLLIEITLSMFLILSSLLLFLGWEFHSSMIYAFLGIYLEAVLLLTISLAFGAFASPVVVIVGAIGFFLAGHGLPGFHELALKSKSEFYLTLSQFFEYIIPNLEGLNWRNFVVYRKYPDVQVVLQSVFYVILWCLAFMLLSVSLFRRRDFV